jgi:hypothetical protein
MKMCGLAQPMPTWKVSTSNEIVAYLYKTAKILKAFLGTHRTLVESFGGAMYDLIDPIRVEM